MSTASLLKVHHTAYLEYVPDRNEMEIKQLGCGEVCYRNIFSFFCCVDSPYKVSSHKTIECVKLIFASKEIPDSKASIERRIRDFDRIQLNEEMYLEFNRHVLAAALELPSIVELGFVRTICDIADYILRPRQTAEIGAAKISKGPQVFNVHEGNSALGVEVTQLPALPERKPTMVLYRPPSPEAYLSEAEVRRKSSPLSDRSRSSTDFDPSTLTVLAFLQREREERSSRCGTPSPTKI